MNEQLQTQASKLLEIITSAVQKTGGVNQVHTNIDPGEPTQPGMTLRDYFAAAAMQGDWASQSADSGHFPLGASTESLATNAELYYRMADAMLKARKEETK